MKKCTLLLILMISFPLIAQQEDISEENIMTGLILEVETNRINFEEMWLPIYHKAHTAHTAQPISIIVTNADGEPINYNDLTAPCLTEVTFEYIEGEIVPLKIKVLEEHQYDSDGLIKKKD